jgi:hypothetical protein
MQLAPSRNLGTANERRDFDFDADFDTDLDFDFDEAGKEP